MWWNEMETKRKGTKDLIRTKIREALSDMNVYRSIAPMWYWLHCERNMRTAAVLYDQPNVNVFIFLSGAVFDSFSFFFLGCAVALLSHVEQCSTNDFWLHFSESLVLISLKFIEREQTHTHTNKCANGHMFNISSSNFFVSICFMP